MQRDDAPGRSPSAYLYILHLDALALAWEYLRRNSQYRADCTHRQLKHIDSRETWNLRFFEDPLLDARHADILWTPTPPDCVRLGALHEDTAASRFSLSNIPGKHTLIADGPNLWLTTRIGTQIFRAYLAPDLKDGDPCAFLIPPGEDSIHHRKARLAFAKVCFSRGSLSPAAELKRPSSIAIFHMHALQALDADLEGASHRDIAVAIFGKARVAEDWSADSYLRAQIRHVLRRAHHLMNGGYRALLKSH